MSIAACPEEVNNIFFEKIRKAVFSLSTAMMVLLTGCSLTVSPEMVREDFSIPGTDTEETEYSQEVNVTAQAMIYIPNPMLDAIFLEYSEPVMLPEDTGEPLYTFLDESAENPQRRITAVYTNDIAETRSDHQSASGRSVVIELEQMENPNPDSQEAWNPETTAGMAIEWSGSVSNRRLDYSEVVLEQCFDAVNEQGQVIRAAGALPELQEENVFWPELNGFAVDQELESAEGRIHYSFYLPVGYDVSKEYPLIVTLPGYNGMWLSDEEHTRGVNLIADRGAVAWTQRDEDVIVVAPKLSDWGEKAARQAIALTEYFIENYAVDTDRIYAAGFSAGGEIMSRVMGKRADLFAAFLHYGSRWSGEYDAVIENRLPVYIYMMEDDEYYGPELAREAYNTLRSRYIEEGLTEEEIAELVRLQIPDREFLNRWGLGNLYMGAHMGGQMAINDPSILDWIMKQHK